MRLCVQTYNFEGKEIVLRNNLINCGFFGSKTIGFLQSLQQDLTIYYNDNFFIINTDNYYYSEKMLDIGFPKYRDVIPRNMSNNYLFNCKNLIQEIKDCVMKKACSFRLTFDIKGDSSIIEYEDENIRNTNLIICNNISKTDIRFTVNYTLLSEILNNIKSVNNSVKFRLSDENSAMIIDCCRDNVKYVFMPYVS